MQPSTVIPLGKQKHGSDVKVAAWLRCFSFFSCFFSHPFSVPPFIYFKRRRLSAARGASKLWESMQLRRPIVPQRVLLLIITVYLFTIISFRYARLTLFAALTLPLRWRSSVILLGTQTGLLLMSPRLLVGLETFCAHCLRFNLQMRSLVGLETFYADCLGFNFQMSNPLLRVRISSVAIRDAIGSATGKLSVGLLSVLY